MWCNNLENFVDQLILKWQLLFDLTHYVEDLELIR